MDEAEDEQSRPVSSWSCHRCTLSNSNMSPGAVCEACGGPRSSSPLPPPQSQASSSTDTDISGQSGQSSTTPASAGTPWWEQPTIVPLPPLPVASATAASRPSSSSLPSSSSGVPPSERYSYSFWVCPCCTFRNNSLLNYCEICEAVNPGTVMTAEQRASATTEGLKKEVEEAKKRLSSAFSGLSLSLKQVYTKAQTGELMAELKEKGEKGRKELNKRLNTTILGGTPSPAAISQLNILRISLQTPVDPSHETYEQLLHRMWDAVHNSHTDNNNQEPISFLKEGEEWLLMGFQRPSPDTDFRGGGMLALRCLVYALEEHNVKMMKIIEEQKPKEGKNSYPVAVAGINVTCLLAGMLRLGDGSFKETRTNYWKLFEDPDAFYELFVAAMLALDRLWHEMGASYMTFGGVLQECRNVMEEVLYTAPQTIKQLRQSAEAVQAQMKASVTDESEEVQSARREGQMD